MTEISEKKTDALVEKLNEDGTVSEGHSDNTDPDCWKSTLIEAALSEVLEMVTAASMAYTDEHGENDELHPMDVVDTDNVSQVYATSEPWSIPVFVVELDEMPEYLGTQTAETREVMARRKPGRTQDETWVRIQIRPSI